MSGLSGVAPEVWLAAGYCLAAVALGYVIDALARRAAASSEGGATGGFTYHEDHDAWQCPEDQWLWPQSFDPDNRVVRYRATPSICNACPVKETCTSSHSGREVQRAVDSWPASEAARFHRWIACSVVLLGLVWPLATLASGVDRTSALVLAAAVLAALVVSTPLWSHLHRSRVVLPAGMSVRSLDETVVERSLTELDLTRRRTHYASDTRNLDKGASS